MKSRSLRSHFLTLYVLLAVLCGIVVPAVSVWLSINAFRNYQTQRRQADLESLGESLTTLYNEEGGIWKRRRVMDILHPAPQWFNMKITLFDASNNEVFTLRPGQQINRRERTNFQGSENSDNDSKSEYITINLGKVYKIGRLEIERKLPSGRFEFSFIAYLMRYSLVGAFIMIMAACGLGFIVARRLSIPVIKAIERTKQISRGDYNTSENLKPVGIRELDALTKGVEDLRRSLSGQEKLRQRLMIDVAHELRTPLTVTRTQIEAIADGILEPTPERLNLCVNEMQRLGGLIENVEALSRLEGEAMAIHTDITNMKEFLEPVLEYFRPVFEKSGIKFSGELESDLTCEIDREKFRHVIDNLLSNAMRYTNSGGEVNVKLCRRSHEVIIEVRDTGIGISSKDLPNIFERFYRADESRARVTGGTGVGLAIVKAAVEAHGGKISVESVKGEGSCFRISLPES